MSFFADAYPRQIDVLTHISPFWRTYESNDRSDNQCGEKVCLPLVCYEPYHLYEKREMATHFDEHFFWKMVGNSVNVCGRVVYF